MFVPNIKTFRQVTLLSFVIISFNIHAETTLYDELNFLREASKEVEVFLPGQEKLIAHDEMAYIEDSISVGQAALLKRSTKEGSIDVVRKKIKKLRYRSR